jgi:hypothetical protein
VWYRYSELRALWEQGPSTIPFPPKRLLNKAPWVVHEREHGIATFLRAALAKPRRLSHSRASRMAEPSATGHAACVKAVHDFFALAS